MRFHTETALTRAEEAIGGYVGNVDLLRCNLRDAIEIARQAESAEASGA